MESTRRKFIKQIGLTCMVTMNLPDNLFANPMESPVKDNRNDKGLTILFQGDSITDGNRTRDNDWNHIMGHGYAYLIASRLWFDYTDKNLMFYNRGISGNRVKDLEARWKMDTLDLKPDILSIMIGVNDLISIVKNWDSEPFEKFEDTFKRLLDTTKQAMPNTQIVLCEPFILPLGWVNENPRLWQEEILKQQILVRKLAESYNAVFVELQEPFNSACKKAPANYWIWDGIHPMPAGHELIARQWINSVCKKLTFII